MNNLVDIQSQIQKLQKQAEDIRAKEFDKTVQEIRVKMEAFGITIKDLQAASTSRKGRPKSMAPKKSSAPKSKRAGVAVAAKYKGPNGETWSGRGLTPRWLASLLEQGRTKEEFAIQS